MIPPALARLAALLLAALIVPVHAHDFEDVARQARKLAARSYEKPRPELPPALAALNYDQYRRIRFRPERAYWGNSLLPFELQFFHLGLFYNLPVRINIVSRDGVQRLPFDPADFDYGGLEVNPRQFRKLGYAGFRVHFPINRSDYKDEVVAFLGASYFRAVGRGQRYGLSARGLAVDTALMSGEEFPRFTEFWIEWPHPEARELVVYALLDSPRVTGAYRFVIRPGRETGMDVHCRLYLRAPVGKLGLAPLTSMFEFGENQPPVRLDYRPEVHDSDGLQILSASGEWIWRPLLNPARVLVTSFTLENPRGFGLMQRDRRFPSYEDLEARYDLRPSAWVEPRGDWGAGRVELVQIPTPDETNDNIVAFWVPQPLPEPGEPVDVRYRIAWEMAATRPPHAWVRQTRREGEGRHIRMILDFEGAALDRGEVPEAVLWTGANGRITEHQLYPNEVEGGWRLALRVRREDEQAPLEMRAYLRRGEQTVSETWSYILPGE